MRSSRLRSRWLPSPRAGFHVRKLRNWTFRDFFRTDGGWLQLLSCGACPAGSPTGSPIESPAFGSGVAANELTVAEEEEEEEDDTADGEDSNEVEDTEGGGNVDDDLETVVEATEEVDKAEAAEH